MLNFIQKTFLFIIPLFMFVFGFGFSHFLKNKEIKKLKIETNQIRIANIELEKTCHEGHDH